MKMSNLYYKAMLKTEAENRKDLANRLNEALKSLGRGGKKDIAEKCGITEQAVQGWVKTGRIDKDNLMIVAETTGYELKWLINGTGEKQKTKKNNFLNESNAEYAPNLGDFKSVAVVGNAQLGDNGYWTDLEYPPGHGDGYIDYPSKDRSAYAIRCTGDSMKPRIKSGEFVIIEPNHELRNGDEVLIKANDGRVMVKTYLYQRDGQIHLMSINEAHPPQSIPLNDVEKMHFVAAIVKSVLWRP